MAEPTRCRFCDEPTEGSSYCDAGCKAGYTLFMPKDDEDDEDEPTAAPTASAQSDSDRE